MPNITIYLNDEDFGKFIQSDKKKEIKDKCVKVIKKGLNGAK